MRLIWTALLLLTLAGCALSDSLSWNNPNGLIWSNFYTSPYYATDLSQNSTVLKIFCLDYNDEIAPPNDWHANIVPLSPGNVQDFQFGGTYPVPATGGATPFAFTGDGLSTSTVTTYQRYLMAAWLFQGIEDALALSTPDTHTAIVDQVAAWELFVDSGHVADLSGRITPGNGTPQADVDAAILAAETAVITNGWTGGGGWAVVTGDAAWIDGPPQENSGLRVQEFLTPIDPVPEPSALALLVTVVGGLAFGWRRRRSSQTRG